MLKTRVEKTGSYFFTRDTMKFFGDTMSNYTVHGYTVMVKRRNGEQVECYMLKRKRAVKHGMKDPAFFCVNTAERILGELA